MDLGKKLRQALAKLTNRPYVDKDDVKALIKDLQRVLISSDVNVKLVLKLSKSIEERALKTDKIEALSLKEHVTKVVYDELVKLMGETYTPRLDKHRILLLGLYGSGKTTTISKLAHFYKTRGLSVGVVAADTDRPAAQEQLEQLAKKVGSAYYTIKGEKNPSKIVADALKKAKEDVIIVDSAGRNALEDELIGELKSIADVLKPDENFLVVSGDIGQIAGNQAIEFSNAVPISGVIVTKMDGSAKGGGALSSVAAANTKIAFIGTGEKPSDFEIYKSEKFVGRLLGVPDIEALIEKINEISKDADIGKIESDELTIESFYEQLKAAKKMGPLGSVLSMMGAADVPKEMVQQSEEKLKKFENMINSMTTAEKKDAALLKNQPSRIIRIAKGAGCTEKEVREFLAQFEKMEKMMNMFKKNRGFRKKVEKMMKGGGMQGMNVG
ncbi:signal recognition particle receptor subunit alpha [Candidatus Micrarchaeota archaeon]|nr:signal recognition particle receptor subunit alpha [Candidatus Micrarchaeota archaeon]MBU1166177.1 signal recognition particle receptor subunit alpha [Candidatus Micrarchaeota archaeon]MBU1886575.1 signal recognition particle receptor subunit alpha [Candidatus Micrarchaeota archaeon]